MDLKTGRIHEVLNDEDAKTRGLYPLSEKEHAEVRTMNRHERRKWAALKRAELRAGKGAR